jgi:hypothetical protein
MDQMDLMGKLQAKLEAAGKMMSKADKNKIMAIENEKLEALKQEQFALQAPRVAPDPGRSAAASSRSPRFFA